MQARGTSMFPFIKDKDSITVQPFYGKQLCIGDIVAFERAGNNNLVIHRIVAKAGNGRYAVKGDNSKQIEICGYPGSIIGKINETHWPGIPNYLVAMLSRFRFFEFIFRVEKWYVNCITFLKWF